MKNRIERLKAHLAAQPVFVPEFQPGDIVRLDNGALGIVESCTDEMTSVYYFNEDETEIKGPSCGWELSRP